MDLIRSWEQKTKEAVSKANSYIAQVEQYCQLKERTDSWLDPLSASEMKTILQLRKQIRGDVGLRANNVKNILGGMTEPLLNLFGNYIKEQYKALSSGNIEEMVKMQEQMPANIIDELLNFHFKHWRDVLEIVPDNTETNESDVTGLIVINANQKEVYQASYLQSLMVHLLLKGYQAILNLLTS